MFGSSGVGGKGNIRPYQQQQNQPQPPNQSLQQLQLQAQQSILQQPPLQHSQQQTQRHHSQQSQQNQQCQQTLQNYPFQQSQPSLHSQQNLIQQQQQLHHFEQEQQLHHLQQEQQLHQLQHEQQPQLYQQLPQTQIPVLPTGQDLLTGGPLTSQSHQQPNLVSQLQHNPSLYSQNIPPPYVQYSTYLSGPNSAANGQIFATTTSIAPPPQQQALQQQQHSNAPAPPPQIPGQPFYFPTNPNSVPFQATPSFYYVPTTSFSHPPPMPQYTHMTCNLNMQTNPNVMIPPIQNICVPSQTSIRENRQKIREHALAVIDPKTKRNVLDDMRLNFEIDSDTSLEKIGNKLSIDNLHSKELCDQLFESTDGIKPLCEIELNLKVDQQMQTDSINHDKENAIANEHYLSTVLSNWHQKQLNENITDFDVPNLNFKSKYWRFRNQPDAINNTEHDTDVIYFSDLYKYKTKHGNLTGKSISSQSIDDKDKTLTGNLGSYDNLWMNSSMEPMPQRVRFDVKTQDLEQNPVNEINPGCSSNVGTKVSYSETDDISNLSKEFNKQTTINVDTKPSFSQKFTESDTDTNAKEINKKAEISYENVSVTCHPNNIFETIVESAKVTSYESFSNNKKVEEVKVKILTKHDEANRQLSSILSPPKKPIKKTDQTNASTSNTNETGAMGKKKKSNKNKRKVKGNKYPPAATSTYTDDKKDYDGNDSSTQTKNPDKNTTGKKKKKNSKNLNQTVNNFKTEQLTLDIKKTEFVDLNELNKTTFDKNTQHENEEDTASPNGGTKYKNKYKFQKKFGKNHSTLVYTEETTIVLENLNLDTDNSSIWTGIDDTSDVTSFGEYDDLDNVGSISTRRKVEKFETFVKSSKIKGFAYSIDVLKGLRYGPLSIVKPNLLQNIQHLSNEQQNLNGTDVQVKVNNKKRLTNNNNDNYEKNDNKSEIIHVKLSLRENIQLTESDNAWRPSTIKSNTENPTEALLKKVRGILNKLTPDNFNTLLADKSNFVMDTKEKMHKVVSLVFEKAVSEPNFSQTYARFCHLLFPENAEYAKMFLNNLILCTQVEYDANVNNDKAIKDKLRPLIERLTKCEDDKEKLDIGIELEEQEFLIRRRAWGTVRFIGELFHSNILSPNIIHRCLQNLLDHNCEEKLEYLCKLLTTVGAKFETTTMVKNKIEVHCNVELNKIFLKLVNIVKSKARNKHPNGNLSNRVRFMIQDVIDLRARNWTTTTTKLLPNHTEKTQDCNRQQEFQASNSNQRKKDYNNSSIYKNSNNSNMNNNNNNNKLHGYSKERRSDRQVVDAEKLLPIFNNDSPKKLGHSSQFMWRDPNRISTSYMTTTPTGSHIQNIPIVTNPQMYSSSKLNSNTYWDSKNKKEQQTNNTSKKESIPSYESETSDSEQFDCSNSSRYEKIINRLIVTSLEGQIEDTLPVWLELNSKYHAGFIFYLLAEYLHQCHVKDQQKQLCSKIFIHLFEKNRITTKCFKAGYNKFCEIVDDILIDVPKMWTYVFQFLGNMLILKILKFDMLWSNNWHGTHIGKEFLKSFISFLTIEYGPNTIRLYWKSNNLKWDKFLKSSDMETFINDNHFEFINDPKIKPPSISKRTHNEVLANVRNMIKENQCIDSIIDYLNGNIININSTFIRHLTEELCDLTILQDNFAKYYVNVEIFKNTIRPLIREYIIQETFQIDYLNTILNYMNRIKYQNDLITQVFNESLKDKIIPIKIVSKWWDSNGTKAIIKNDSYVKELVNYFKKKL